jgi:hypothetical protein
MLLSTAPFCSEITAGWPSASLLQGLDTPVTPRVLPPQSTVTPSSTAPDTQALLPAEDVLELELDATLELELDLLDEELEATLELELDLLEDELEATLELLLEAGPIEHHALESKLLDGNSEEEQVKLPVSVA